MVCYVYVSSMRHIYGTSFDNTGQHIFLKKTDTEIKVAVAAELYYVQPPRPQFFITNQICDSYVK